uniref:CoA carboxyltransferase N-terminal domain-containing protein n=2 Tax=Mesocestoides corti TaxID=53468 RepID=A0A5K3G3S5_MESCO
VLNLGYNYVYDYPVVLGQVLDGIWNVFSGDPSSEAATEEPRAELSRHILQCKELRLNNDGDLVHVERTPSLYEIGVVVWYIVMSTPEYPEGRPIILIANDDTLKEGSFGPRESLVFCRASELARRLRIPRIFISSTAGALFGLAEEVKSVFRVAWVDEN